MNKILLYLGDALHKMQAERGCAVLFVSSKGKLFNKELLQAFKESHNVIEKIRRELKEWHENHGLDDDFLQRMEIVLDNSETVKSRRNKILNLKFSPSEIINGYSHNVISPLIHIMVLVALFNKNNDPTKVSAYSYFLQLKEKTGRIRALGTRGLVAKSFNNSEFIDRFRFLIAEQDSFKRTFFAMANDKQKKLYDHHMHGNSIRKLVEIHNGLIQSQKHETPDLTPTDWFHMTSEKMNLMKKIEDELAEDLVKNDARADNPPQVTRIQVSHAIDGISTNQRAFIEELPFFINLSEEITNGLLQHAQVREYKKGKLLFLEGEVSSRLHIILSGWIKLFKGTSSGNETVLQMLTSGDMVAESAVFLNATYPASAQVVKKTVVLTLPAPIIRERIKQHNELALRVVDGISKHSQSLIQEFENIRLKPAPERVGWFLLKLLLDQGELADLIDLPYDKSLMASYLDMKPETFSRILKKFKENDFEINKNTVILPNINALCCFCDHDLVAICNKHKTPECPNPDSNQDIGAAFK